jgi:hypothetical protein
MPRVGGGQANAGGPAVEPVEEEPPENHDGIRTLETVPRFLEWSTNEADVWRYYLKKKGVKDSKNMDVFCVVCYLQGTEVEKCYKKMNGGTTNLVNHVNIAKSGHGNTKIEWEDRLQAAWENAKAKNGGSAVGGKRKAEETALVSYVRRSHASRVADAAAEFIIRCEEPISRCEDPAFRHLLTETAQTHLTFADRRVMKCIIQEKKEVRVFYSLLYAYSSFNSGRRRSSTVQFATKK